ncbi:MAG: hypothetical protein JSU00_02060 [Acidobacteria bacterium]|nr:hypothetical protein [Acidobacteriota bacterium]
MARGWESKSVESQAESAAEAKAARATAPRKTRDEVELEGKLHGLMLSRTRVLNDLNGVSNPRYRQQLEQALAFLDHQIAALGSEPAA